MFARALLLAVSLLLCAAPPASAQSNKTESASPAPAAAAAPADSAASIAGGDVVRALVIGSGLLDSMLEQMGAHILPDMRNQMTNSAFYRTLSRPRRDALLAFLDTTPALLRREIEAEVEVIAARAGPRLAALMNADELAGIAAFMRSPDARPMFESLSRGYMENGQRTPTPSDFSDQDIRVLGEFMSTPGGVAFYRNSEAINGIVRDEFDQATVRMMPRLQIAMFDGICQALEEDCPLALRQPT